MIVRDNNSSHLRYVFISTRMISVKVRVEDEAKSFITQLSQSRNNLFRERRTLIVDDKHTRRRRAPVDTPMAGSGRYSDGSSLTGKEYW